MNQTVWARRPIKYMGHDYARGEIFQLGGAINDEKLVRLGYVAEIDGSEETYEFQGTGRFFIDMSTRAAYGEYLRRMAGARTPQDEDRIAEFFEKQLEEAAPLYIGV